MIKSHVQQPKLILKQFCNENGELYYYSFTEDTINKFEAFAWENVWKVD